MTLEQQVTSLDLSRRLKELGVKQKSLFWWSENEHDRYTGWVVFYKDEVLGTEERFSVDKEVHISAFTVSELGEMLPGAIVTWSFADKSGCGVQFNVSLLGNKRPYVNSKLIEEHSDTLPDAMAKMLIYLVENKLISV